MVNQDKVYAFLFNPCVEESGFITMSLHRIYKGAKTAMDQHREREYNLWLIDMEKMKRLDLPTENFQFGEFQCWDVHEILIQD